MNFNIVFVRYDSHTISPFYHLTTPAPRDTWIHITWVWYGKDVGFGIFHDGSFVGNSTQYATGSPRTTAYGRELRFGESHVAGDPIFFSSFELDELLIFESAFTTEEVAQLYNRRSFFLMA